MKVIIQCAGWKQSNAGRLKNVSGADVLFVIRPDLCPGDGQSSIYYCRPDDPVEPGLGTWRETLVAYNRSGENPYGLSAAADLYRPAVYRSLVSAFGRENIFILSAGWGLIRSDFLTPDYDITFSTQAPDWARRPKQLVEPLTDLNHLASSRMSPAEPIHFFGGRDYLPLLRALTTGLAAKIVVHHKGSPPAYSGFTYEAFCCNRNQNWHYAAADAFINATLLEKSLPQRA
jgi:hypothetical protein